MFLLSSSSLYGFQIREKRNKGYIFCLGISNPSPSSLWLKTSLMAVSRSIALQVDTVENFEVTPASNYQLADM